MYPGEHQTRGSFHDNSNTANWRELHAIGRAIVAFHDRLASHRRIRIRTDSVTAAAYINKEGGPVSHLIEESKRILMEVAWPDRLTLHAVHVPALQNKLADRLSRMA